MIWKSSWIMLRMCCGRALMISLGILSCPGAFPFDREFTHSSKMCLWDMELIIEGGLLDGCIGEGMVGSVAEV